MNQSEAITHLRTLMYGTQKLRSILAEDGIITDNPAAGSLSMDTEQAGKVWKWIWGDNCILKPLQMILDRVEGGQQLDPLAFYNMMYIALELEPLLGAVAGSINSEFPKKMDLNWLFGW